VRAMELLFERLDAARHLLEKIVLLLDDVLQCVNLLIQLRFNINGAPIIVYAHSVKSVVFLRGVMGSAGRLWLSRPPTIQRESAARSAARRGLAHRK